jgi:hypothetical protein
MFKFFQTSFDIYFEDVDIQSSGAKVSKILIDEYIPYGVPLMELALEIHNDALLSYMYDGVKISLRFKVENNQSDLFVFRLMTCDIQEGSKNFIAVIGAYLDISAINHSVSYSQNSTSSQVASYIAKVGNFKSDISQTNDKQVWICYGKTLYDFLFDMSYNAWINSSSCIVSCFNNNKLKYKNISDQILKEAKIRFVPTPENIKNKNDVSYDSARIKINSGVQNQVSGYGIVGNNFNILTGVIETTPFKIPLIKTTDKTNLNKDLVKIQRSESLPVDSGNTHPNYYSAKLQNLRIKTLYSVSVEVSTQFLINLELLDTVELVMADSKGQPRKQYSGKYIIERVRYLKNENDVLTFIYTLTRPGMSVESGMKSSDLKLQ